MAHDVFVSYPNADKPLADAVVNKLETDGIRCWVAPRDVPPGADWAGSIVEAIEHSRMAVLVFSDATNQSEHILREVRAASDAGIAILPLRTTRAEPAAALKYYIGGTHWLDALTEDLERHLGELATTVGSMLRGDGPVTPSSPAALHAPGPRTRPLPMNTRLGVAAAAVVVAVFGGIVAVRALSSDDSSAAVETAQPDEEPTATSEPTDDAPPTSDAEEAAEPEPPSAEEPDKTSPPTGEPADDRTAAAGDEPTAATVSFVAANREGPNRICTAALTGESQCEEVGADTWSEGVAVADFDGNGQADLVFANSGPNTVCLADGEEYRCSALSADDVYSHSVAAADVNGDGNADLVIGNGDLGRWLTPERAHVCLGDGSGAFTCSTIDDTTIETQASPETEEVAVADLDLDGNLDIVLALHNWKNQVCFGDGGGRFDCVDIESEMAFTMAVAVDDFDDDGGPDVFFANTQSPNRLCLGQGRDRAFLCSDQASDPSHVEPVSALAVAIQEPDHLDLVIGGDGDTTFWRGDGTGSFENPVRMGHSFQAHAVVAVDLDGAAPPELLVIGVDSEICRQHLECSTLDLNIRDDRGLALPAQLVDVALLP